MKRTRSALQLSLLLFAPDLINGQTNALRSVPIIDPVLQMQAWMISAPADWRTEGTMLPGSACNNATSPIYRTISPDGLTGAYLLPRIDWAWGAATGPSADCLPAHEVISAKDFLTYLIRIRQLGFVQEEPVPELEESRRQTEAFNQQARGSMQSSVDIARFLVRYSLNGRSVEEQITANLNCSDRTVAGVGHQYGCSAFITRWFAPLGKLHATMPTFQAMKLTLNQPWMDQWTAVMVRRFQMQTQRQTDALLEQGRLAGAQRNQQHRDFMASMRRGRDLRNDRFQEGQFLKQKNKEDYVDYILDCQRLATTQARVAVGNCPVRQTY